jgi:hypothetical protein
MVLSGIQIIGILFGIFMLYLTFLYYKRRDFYARDFAIWFIIWGGFLAVISFPDLFRLFLQPLYVYRLMDLITIVAFIVMFLVLFVSYRTSKQNEKRLKEIVRKLAIRESER